MSEFSNDSGANGKGIVVNLGTYDATNGYGGSAWTGTLRGHALNVPVAGVVVSGSGESRTVTAMPIAAQTGTSTVALAVSDGTLTSQPSFVLYVVAAMQTPPTSRPIVLSVARSLPPVPR